MKRIYVVTNKADKGAATDVLRLVRAGGRVQAENFVARDTIKASLATQDELVHLIAVGVKVEEAAGEIQADLGN